MVDLSIVIPTYTVNKEVEEITVGCILSLAKDMAIKEIIVTEDGGFFSPQFMELADIYIYSKSNIGFSSNANRGWRVATGDYVAIVNSDITLREGELSALCIPGKVTSPETINEAQPRLAGHFFVVPKEVAVERGMLLEEMKLYCSDSEYDNRVADIFQSVPTVKIVHHTQATTSRMDQNLIAEAHGRDEEIYLQLKKEGRVS
jgi:hypothetical protein